MAERVALGLFSCQQRQFLAAYERTGSMRAAARIVGVSYYRVYTNWQAKSEFRAALQAVRDRIAEKERVRRENLLNKER